MVQEREISMRDHDHGGMHTVLTSYSLRIVFLVYLHGRRVHQSEPRRLASHSLAP